MKCKICSSNEVKKMVNWRKYEIYKCSSCEVLFSHPDPTEEELTQFYQGFLHSKPNKKNIEQLKDKKIKELRELFNLEEGPTTSKKILDYGGGTGMAYSASQQLGLDHYYHDIDQDSIEFVKETFGLPEERFIKDVENTNLKFDYIFVDNVIEHLIDPKDLIQKLYAKLNTNGLLVFKTPNANNSSSYFYPRTTIEGYFLQAMKYNSLMEALKVYFSRCWHCDPPRHLYSFTKLSFDALMSKIGISKNNYEISYYQHPLFEFSFTRSFFFVDREYKGISSILIRIIAFPLVMIELLTKIIQFGLYKFGLLSAVGLVLAIKKG